MAERHHDPVYFNNASVKADFLGSILTDPIERLGKKAAASSSDSVIILSDFLDVVESDETVSPFSNTRKVVLLHCYDPAELKLPYTGRVNFSNMREADIIVENVSAVRKEYFSRLSVHQKKLQNYASTRGWLYRKFDTSENLSSIFLETQSYFEDRI